MSEFATLLSAVKPKERGDQYRILAALYDLKAHITPVTAKQVTDLLKLHCGNKVPSNVNSSLRAYTGLVTPVANNSQRLWSLTSMGLTRLRTTSGLALDDVAKSTTFQTDVGIICALEHPELAAVINALGGPNAWREAGDPRFAHVYRETTLTTKKNCALKVVATTSTSMGLTAAAIATTQLVIQFRPKIVVMIGIAAGTRSGNKQFGDVLVADPSVDYNSGKVVDAGGIRAFLPDPYPIGLNPRLRSILHKYHGNHPVFSGKSPYSAEFTGISPVAQKWIQRNGLQPEQLSSIFSLGGDEIDLIANKVPGKSKRTKMRSVFLLKGVAAYLSGGAARIAHDKIKETCLHYGAFDQPHFATYMKEFASEISGSKESGYTLTARGLANAAILVKEILGLNQAQ